MSVIMGLPETKFDCIVVDPPWPMRKIKRKVRPNQYELDYPVLSIDEIYDLRISRLAASNCHLFLWTTHKYLPTALACLSKWGFTYVCLFVWHKTGGPQPVNLPQYNCEFVVYARKGTPKFTEVTAFNACFMGPRREHSRKPDEFYSMVRRVVDGNLLDMFARSERPGWTVWGNEINKFS